MNRHDSTPRQNWTRRVQEHGLIWHTIEDKPYWNEESYYSFSMKQIHDIENATMSVYDLLLEAGQYVLDNELLGQFGIPSYVHDAIYKAWDDEPPCLNYGRMDFGYDGINPPKFFEFNCDTPTSILEAAVIQWFWKEDVHPTADQFNSLHEKLVERWRYIKPYLPHGPVHFTHVNDPAGEDTISVSYMRDIAEEAGIDTIGVLIDEIGWDGRGFVDLDNHYMQVIQHLYPWEWLVNEEFGKNIISTKNTLWIEPIWKMMWSNKAILPILWKIAPNHPNLLAAFFDNPTFDMDVYRRFVKKPILSREGANVTIMDRVGTIVKSEGEYGEEGFIYQEFFAIPDFGGGRYPVIGSWSVDREPAGMGIREDGLITGNTARFIPHIIVD